jgi:predicted DNA-binding protein
MVERKTRNQPDYDIRITNKSEDLLNQIKAISKNTGESMSTLLRPVIREWVKSYPADYKIMPEENKK